MHVVEPRVVDLGVAGTMSVQRTIPTRGAHRVGAWVFVDHFSVHDVDAAHAMNVGAHPHTGLQTASWLFEGVVEHRDSGGVHDFIKPGELNLMTAGRGIAHSEHSVPIDGSLQGVQLWIALPEDTRFSEPSFAHYVPTPITGPGFTARVFLGSLLGSASPVHTYTALLGAQLDLEPGAALELPLSPGFEHGILVDIGEITVVAPDGITSATEGRLVVLPAGPNGITIEAHTRTRLILLGGEPFEEPIIMWWNLIGRTHEEIIEWRQRWIDEVDGSAVAPMFGLPVDDVGDREPVPPAPATHLKPRT